MTTKVFFRSGYNYDRDAVSVETGFQSEEETLTQQNFQNECDINTIVRRFGVTGELPSNVQMPVSGDFTGISDFHSAMNVVRQAEEQFLALPADLRARFLNDPARLISFLDDPANRDQAVQLGLVNAPPALPAVPDVGQVLGAGTGTAVSS